MNILLFRVKVYMQVELALYLHVFADLAQPNTNTTVPLQNGTTLGSQGVMCDGRE
jgi:hypothetical protein